MEFLVSVISLTSASFIIFVRSFNIMLVKIEYLHSLRFIFVIWLGFAGLSVCAQNLPSGKKITENGKTFVLYKVQQGETLYSLGKRYQVDLQELTAVNPQLTKGLKAGMTIKIPVGGEPIRNSKPEAEQKPERILEHQVLKKETLYSISRKYGISIDQLLAFNPGKSKLKKGEILRIPQWSDPRKKIDAAASSREAGRSSVVLHPVKEGETLYALSRKYNVTVDDIIRSNPFLETKLPHPGDTLRIVTQRGESEEQKPVAEKSDVALKPGDCDLLPASVREKKKIKVALLIPLMMSENKLLNHELWGKHEEIGMTPEGLPSDTLRSNTRLAGQMQFHGNSENFIHFYEGALLALDSLEKAGIRVEMEVWDTEQKPSKVKNFVSSGVLSSADLIIGPVYPNEQKEIVDFAAKQKIPIISPLSPSDEYTRENEYFFQVNPSRDFTSLKTREYIVSSYRNCNIVVLQTSASGNEAENESAALRKALEKEGDKGSTPIRICNFRKDGFASLRKMMDKEKKNVLVLPTVNEAEVSVVVSNMKALSAEFDVVVIGNNRFPQFESIDPEHYHYANLEFLTPYWPDLNQQVPRSFIHNFRVHFRTDPNQYSIQGYDVTFFFVKALSDYGDGFVKCLSKEKASLVQGNYMFRKLASGGYINNGLSVVQYLPSFEIVRKQVILE